VNDSDEPVSFSRNRLYKAWLFGIVFQDLSNFPDGCIDAVVGIDKNFLPPDSLDDLIAHNEVAGVLQQQAKQFQRNPFEFQRLARAAQFVGTKIEFEVFSEFDQTL
jgi:hypothetical protein